jgi:hypothetical protein
MNSNLYIFSYLDCFLKITLNKEWLCFFVETVSISLFSTTHIVPSLYKNFSNDQENGELKVSQSFGMVCNIYYTSITGSEKLTFFFDSKYFKSFTLLVRNKIK